MHYAYRPHFLFRTLFLLLLLLTRKKGELDDEHVDKVGSQHGQYEGAPATKKRKCAHCALVISILDRI